MTIMMYHSQPLLDPQLPTLWPSQCTTACHYWIHNYLPYGHRDVPQPAIIGPTTTYHMAITMYHSLPLLDPQLPTLWPSWCTTACHYWSYNYLPTVTHDLLLTLWPSNVSFNHLIPKASKNWKEIRHRTLNKRAIQATFTLQQDMKAQRGSTLTALLLTLALDWGGWSTPHPSCFTPRKQTQYPLGGLHSQSGREWKISPPTRTQS
jgi:hypothetical protein